MPILLIIITLLFLFLCYLFLLFPRFTKKEEILSLTQKDFAHRGLFSQEKLIPENSMSAFREALKYSLGIELDVHLTKDQQVVVFHDDTLLRMCNVNHSIEELTFAELQKLYLQNTSERIPLLTDVLSYIHGRVPLLIEVKLPTKNTKLCEILYSQLTSYPGVYLIQSFNTMALYWFRRHAPEVLRGQLSSNLMKDRKNNYYFLCVLSRFLLFNVFGRPDFISYKLKDAQNISLFLLQKLLKIPIAVWTLRTKKAYYYGKTHYDICIFENFQENY